MNGSDNDNNRGLELSNVTFGYGRKPLFDGLNLYCKPGEIVAIAGPNGCGKTTLLNLISGLLKPQDGLIELGITDNNSGKGLFRTFQNPVIVEELTLVENMLSVRPVSQSPFDLKAWLSDPKTDICDAKELLGKLGIEKFAQEQGAVLSLGVRRLLSVAQALFSRASLILFDEPFANVHEDGIEKARRLICDAARCERRMFVVVEHRGEAVAQLADRVIQLGNSGHK